MLVSSYTYITLLMLLCYSPRLPQDSRAVVAARDPFLPLLWLYVRVYEVKVSRQRHATALRV